MKTIYSQLELLRKTNPLIVNLTNFVSVQTVANVLLALGASPIMSQAQAELKELMSFAQALCINIGTLHEDFLQQVEIAQLAALNRNIPIVLDPVGVGATAYRTQNAVKILERGIDIVRGNASEIMALAGAAIKTKGVDSSVSSGAAIESAQNLARQYDICVVISGEEDIVVDYKKQQSILTGDILMTKITGLGCAASSCVAAFAAGNKNYFESAVAAMAVFGAAGKKAAEMTPAPGTFYPLLLDNLYQMKIEDLNNFCELLKSYEII